MKAACASACLALVVQPVQLLEYIANEERAHASRAAVVIVQYCGDSSFVEGTEEWELYPDLRHSSEDMIVQKRTSTPFEGTSLQEQLRGRGITRLVVTGIASQWCVRDTCLHAKELGYGVTLVKDAHGTATLNAADVIEKVHSEFLACGIAVKATAEIVF